MSTEPIDNRVLVFGGTGLLGAPLALRLVARGCQVYVVSRLHHFAGTTRIQSRQCDVALPGAGRQLLQVVKPHSVINCAAITNVDACETSGIAERVNADWPRELAAAAAEQGARCVHISTDSVFERKSGQRAPKEKDARSPVNAYGRQKAKGEDGALDASDGTALVVRTNFFGWSPRPERGLAAWALRELRMRHRIRGFADVFFSPLYTTDAIDLLITLMDANVKGVTHVLGSQCLSKLSFLRILAKTFSLDAELIDEARLDDAMLTASRPRNTCLSTNRLEDLLGRPAPTAEDGLLRMLREETSLRAELSSVQQLPRRTQP